MARRSVRASVQGILTIKQAVRSQGWTQTDLAARVPCSRQTISIFLQGKSIARSMFMDICTQLGLNWEEIAEPELPEPTQSDTQDIDALVQEIRERLKSDIQERCGTIRVLDMTQPIALGDIYTSVNILDKITAHRGFERPELGQDASPEMFERFGLLNRREHRIPGLEAVEKFSKLMILGKPGAGKTTFLKHLSVECIGGGFQGNRFPVFISLKDFAEVEGQPDLLEYITRLVATHSVGAHSRAPLKPGIEIIQEILLKGRALILLDGLDEVKETDNSRILRQIREFSLNYPLNQFIITCRIAAKEYTFEKFTEVEIADFNDEQIADFSGKWFHSKNDPIKAKSFLQKLKENAPIRELATIPLLLTLLCLLFEDTGSFPINLAELYQIEVDVLLKKWDMKRNIERDQVYKRLSLKRKEDLLSQIAYITFEAGNYFFKQREVERYITKYIQNLPEASSDSGSLELDSVAVLKSIEAQYGLLVERAKGIYSFSHLTLHEYFAARKIVTSCNAYMVDDPTLHKLVSHVTEKRWRKVILLTVEMLHNADVLLRLMKVQVDGLLAGDEKLQQHRNIGHEWQFNDTQKQLLQQYYEANKLLIDCLNSDCYVSPEVRQEIEETLLLPLQEIEKRNRV